MYSKIKAIYLTARKNKDKKTADTLRLLISDIDNEQLEVKRDLNESEIIAVIKRHIKSIDKLRKEVAGSSREAEVIESTQADLDLLNSLLPKMLSEDEILAVLESKGAEKGMNMGQLMGMIMKDHKDEVNGATVKAVIEANFVG